jgi:RNA polymerase sigma factor (sigma-70 family)
MPDFEQTVVSNLNAFLGYARKRIGDPELAADIVQDSLIKALQAARQPTESEQMVPWFYQILRRSIIDTYRRNDSRARAMKDFENSLPETADPEITPAICSCFKGLLPDLPKQYQDILREVDLEGNSLAALAREHATSANNLNVRLFRARQHLRRKLETLCKSCATHGCIDCTCKG